MKCLFCKEKSANQKSIEHIIPESIGNKKHVLPRGAVCDKCNNYFSRKIEGPLLSHKSFRNIRAWYQVPNKRGVKPSMHGFVGGAEIDIGLRLNKEGLIDIRAEFGRDQEKLDKIKLEFSETGNGAFIFEMDMNPPKYEMSRFLAKMALEALYLRMSSDQEICRMLLDDPYYDRIRNWARFGEKLEGWPYYQRQIFPQDTLMKHPVTRDWVQAGFGHDLFMTKRQETYFVFCFYGYEFTINIGGPSIKGYEEWLVDNKNISPLVERIGLRLEQGVDQDSGKFFLMGEQEKAKGVLFDKIQMSNLY